MWSEKRERKNKPSSSSHWLFLSLNPFTPFPLAEKAAWGLAPALCQHAVPALGTASQREAQAPHPSPLPAPPFSHWTSTSSSVWALLMALMNFIPEWQTEPRTHVHIHSLSVGSLCHSSCPIWRGTDLLSTSPQVECQHNAYHIIICLLYIHFHRCLLSFSYQGTL